MRSQMFASNSVNNLTDDSGRYQIEDTDQGQGQDTDDIAPLFQLKKPGQFSNEVHNFSYSY